ncbi:hypothetical protein ACIFOT_31390 [Neobacillus sp. NRS-1170]|uniref:hypothetical protein n=1 Tax=Neobacillus sp. NRS-1170 TaxID=3233898 RepID=UPI003D2A69E3
MFSDSYKTTAAMVVWMVTVLLSHHLLYVYSQPYFAGLSVASIIPLNLCHHWRYCTTNRRGAWLRNCFRALDCSLDRGTDRNLDEIWFYNGKEHLKFNP